MLQQYVLPVRAASPYALLLLSLGLPLHFTSSTFITYDGFSVCKRGLILSEKTKSYVCVLGNSCMPVK